MPPASPAASGGSGRKRSLSPVAPPSPATPRAKRPRGAAKAAAAGWAPAGKRLKKSKVELSRLRRWYGDPHFSVKDVEGDGDCLYHCMGLAMSQRTRPKKAYLRRYIRARRREVADSLDEFDFLCAHDPEVKQTSKTGKFKDLAGLRACITTVGADGGRWADTLEIVKLCRREKVDVLITELLARGVATISAQSRTEARILGESKLTKIGVSKTMGQVGGSRVMLYQADTGAPLGKWRTTRDPGDECCRLTPAADDGATDVPADWVGRPRRVTWEQVQHLRLESGHGDADPRCLLLLRTGNHYKLIARSGVRAMRWSELPQSVRDLDWR